MHDMIQQSTTVQQPVKELDEACLNDYLAQSRSALYRTILAAVGPNDFASTLTPARKILFQEGKHSELFGMPTFIYHLKQKATQLENSELSDELKEEIITSHANYTAAANELAERNVRLAYGLAKRFRVMSREDRQTAALEALLDAAYTYDHSRALFT